MKTTSADIIIIGAGIVGSSIALELSSSNNKIITLEAKTISSQTSSSSSKMLHGGIRYLENFDFKLVFEALKEKNYWLKEKPHLTRESVFYLPVYKESKWPLIAMKFGVFLYNLLSGFKNSRYSSLSKSELLNKFPMIKSEGLKGAAAYSDAIIDDKQFTIEIAQQAKDKGVSFYENTEVLAINKNNDHYEILTNNGSFNCKKIIVACGPFTDKIMKVFDKDWKNIMLLSKGVHLWIKKDSLKIDSNIVLQTKDNRIIFIIDHLDKILIGTTEKVIPYNELDFDLEADKDEVSYILKNVNEYLKTNENLNRTDIISSYSGIRPLVKDQSKSSSKTSREHVILNPSKDFYVITGGKYTTCRVMAQQVVKKVLS